jgi:hypothetical protein
MVEEQRAAQNVPICTPLAMNATVLTSAHSGGYARGVSQLLDHAP